MAARTASSRRTRSAEPRATPEPAEPSGEPTFFPYAATTAEPPSEPRAETPAVEGGLTSAGIFGGALLVGCILGLVLNFAVPWLVVDPVTIQSSIAVSGTSEVYHRDELMEQYEELPNPYYENLVAWPLWAFIGGMVVGGALLIIDYLLALPRVAKSAGRTSLLVSAAYLGLVLALTGTRWLGLYFATLLREGDVLLQLHAAPYINLVLGTAMLAGALTLLRPRLREIFAKRGPTGARTMALAASVAAVGILALPLLPFGVADTPFLGQVYLAEGDLAFMATSADYEAQRAGKDLEAARAMLWGVLAASVASAVLAARGAGAARPSLGLATLSHLFALTAIPLLAGMAFTAGMYAHLAKVDFLDDRVAISFNFLLPASWLALLALYVLYARGSLLPFVRRAARGAAPSS